MISGRYVRYRNIFYCIYCDICDAIRRAVGRKKTNPVEVSKNGYPRWINLEQGGGVNTGIPGISEGKKEDKKKSEGSEERKS